MGVSEITNAMMEDYLHNHILELCNNRRSLESCTTEDANEERMKQASLDQISLKIQIATTLCVVLGRYERVDKIMNESRAT